MIYFHFVLYTKTISKKTAIVFLILLILILIDCKWRKIHIAVSVVRVYVHFVSLC